MNDGLSSRDALADWIEALPAGIPFVFDPTPVIADIPRPILDRVLARTTWLSCNTNEAAEIAGAGDAQTVAIRLLAEHCPRAEGVVIRAGAHGLAQIHAIDKLHEHIKERPRLPEIVNGDDVRMLERGESAGLLLHLLGGLFPMLVVIAGDDPLHRHIALQRTIVGTIDRA